MINISKTVLAEALYEVAPDVYTTREAALAAAEKIVAAVREREGRAPGTPGRGQPRG